MKEIGPGYDNRIGSHILAPSGRGHYGTSESFKTGMKANVKRIEEEAAARAHLKGWEREALEQEKKRTGADQSHH